MTRTRLFLFLAGLTLLAGLAAWAGMGAVLRALVLLGAGGLAAITLIHLPVLLMMGLAWWSVGRDARGARPHRFIAARLVRDCVAEVLPFSQVGGFVGGLRLLSLLGTDAAAGAFALFADLVIEFAAKLLYALAGVLALAGLEPGASLLAPLALGLALAVAAGAAAISLRGQLAVLVDRLAGGMVRRWAPRSGIETGPALAACFALSRAAPGFAIHLFCWLFGAAEAWLTFHLMGVPVTAGEALVIDSLGTTLRTFGFLVPGAAGVQEAAYVLVCALFGLGPAQAVAFSLARRARDLVIGIPGLAAWQALEARAWRRRAEALDAPSARP
ncbi:MAG TPA: lysylphosphatidylglycerol synthase domain-containing protein [Rhizomicrobium sp.]|nr:lysylphosphatidylglycerol synthase domain-containing protein [Rhizomicrobium sp.]